MRSVRPKSGACTKSIRRLAHGNSTTKKQASSNPIPVRRARFCAAIFFFQAEDGIRGHCVTGVQTCALPIFNLDELYPAGIHERDLALAPDPERISLRNFFLWLDRLHKFAEWFAENNIHPFRKLALKKAERWMLERFEGSDGLAAIFPAMLNALIALKALGYPATHPQVIRAENELKRLEHE